MNLPLKPYQSAALTALKSYLSECHRLGDVDTAFIKATKQAYSSALGVAGIESIPHVCLRIPTGGGKTLVACHAVGTLLQEWKQADRGIVLWLAPTTTIVEQTLRALREKKNPYREALEAATDGSVEVLTSAEALSLSPATVDTNTVVIVCTMAAFRVEETEGRKVYDDNGSLSGHFSGRTEKELAGLEKLGETGRAKHSLANVLALHRPLVIVDEAHRFTSGLSFQVLGRFAPAAILELSATPDKQKWDTNVLHRTSAYELKSDAMIKLPLFMQESPHWEESVRDALLKRAELEDEAKAQEKAGGAYLRPILLLQAQKSNEALTVEYLETYLVEKAGVPKEWIAVEYKNRADLEGVTISARTCPIRIVITVDKLREGWDCPFAYILCSVRDSKSATAVEQLLGRVLRMPGAKKQSRASLNKAYIYVTGEFARCVKQLEDALVESGFTAGEVKQILQTKLHLPSDPGLATLFAQKQAPAQRGERFSVPQLTLFQDGDVEPLEPESFLSPTWKLAECSPQLTQTEFEPEPPRGVVAEFDITERGKLDIHKLAERMAQYSLTGLETEQETTYSLAVWLDRHIKEPRIPQAQKVYYCQKVLEYLTTTRGLSLDALAGQRMRLRAALERKIGEHIEAAMRTQAQVMLFDSPETPCQVSAERVFTFDPDAYPVNKPHPNIGEFRKHYYPEIDLMNGEELLCARFLESAEAKVKFWVRNIPQRERTSFWLPLPNGHKFYPDFIALLEDNRVLVIEYKGAHLLDNPEERDKDRVGKLWAESSKGSCLFVYADKTDLIEQVTAQLRR
jgi:type III restriction enzyme